MKCGTACSHFGKKAHGPTNVLPIDDCIQLFSEYETALFFYFAKHTRSRDERVA